MKMDPSMNCAVVGVYQTILSQPLSAYILEGSIMRLLWFMPLTN